MTWQSLVVDALIALVQILVHRPLEELRLRVLIVQLLFLIVILHWHLVGESLRTWTIGEICWIQMILLWLIELITHLRGLHVHPGYSLCLVIFHLIYSFHLRA